VTADDASSLPIGLYTFVDESYSEDHYYVGGIVVTSSQLADLEQQLNAFMTTVADKFHIDPATELHGHEIMQGQDSWACLSGQVHESVWICRKVIQTVVNVGAHIHMQGVNVRRLNARYRYPDSPYRVALRHLLERVHDECERQEVRSPQTSSTSPMRPRQRSRASSASRRPDSAPPAYATSNPCATSTQPATAASRPPTSSPIPFAGT
jgi:hypothetical protein